MFSKFTLRADDKAVNFMTPPLKTIDPLCPVPVTNTKQVTNNT